MQIIRYDHDVVAERACDTLFFKLIPQERMWEFDDATREQHLAWFNDWDLSVEKVGFLGLLIGESGYYHVDFTGLDDPRLILWSRIFEDAEGKSLAPDRYQMCVYPYQLYLDRKAAGELEPIDPDDW